MRQPDDDVVTFVRDGYSEDIEVPVPPARQGPAPTLRDLAARATERVHGEFRRSGLLPRQAAQFIRGKGWSDPYRLPDPMLRSYIREWVNDFFTSADNRSGSAPLKG